MIIEVVGAGSLGLLYAAKLAKAGIQVRLWTRTIEQADHVNKEGLILIQADEREEVSVEAQPIEKLRDFDFTEYDGFRWIWLTVKQTHLTHDLLESLERLAGSDAAVLCLQNGIGHLELLKKFVPQERLYPAVTTDGALRVDQNAVIHTGQGETWFGNSDDRDVNPAQGNMQKMLLNTADTAGIPMFLSKEINDRIYQKLLINAVINPLTALFDVKNGELPEHPSRMRLMERLYIESETVLLLAGMRAMPEGLQRVMDVCSATSANVSSMLTDVRNGRETEIHWINGGISALARRLGVAAPLNEAITELIRGIQPLAEKRGE